MPPIEVDTTTRDKRQLFIDATIKSLSENGYKATTVRQIAKIAGVAPGLLTHYFEGKEVLIAESYAHLARTFLDRFESNISGLESHPITALKTFIEATFAADNLDPKVMKVWLSFWSLTLSEPSLKHIHSESYNRYVAALTKMLEAGYVQAGQHVSPAKAKQQAIGINALLDGMWIEWCLNPETFTPDEGLKIVYEFVESVTGLQFPD